MPFQDDIKSLVFFLSRVDYSHYTITPENDRIAIIKKENSFFSGNYINGKQFNKALKNLYKLINSQPNDVLQDERFRKNINELSANLLGQIKDLKGPEAEAEKAKAYKKIAKLVDDISLYPNKINFLKE